jgi:hypothetical protein
VNEHWDSIVDDQLDDRVVGAIPFDAWGPEQRLPPAVQAWLDPSRPLPSGVALIGLSQRPPVGAPLAAAFLLGASVGALILIVAKEAGAGRWGSGALGLGLTLAVALAALAFARKGLAGLAERWGGGRRSRRGIFLGAAGGEALLLVRARLGEARLWPRRQVFAVELLRGEDRGAPGVLSLRAGPEPEVARSIRLPGTPEGGGESAAAQLRAWIAGSALR